MKNKFVNIFELLLFVFLLMLKFIFIDKYSDLYLIANSVFWILALVYAFSLIGFRKDNHICKTNSIQITIIGLLLYILFSYLSGLFFGFIKTGYSLKFVSIISNITPVIIMIVSQELIRWMISNKSKTSKLPLIILTGIYVAFDILLAYNKNISGGSEIFVFIAGTCLTSVARNAFASYVSYRVSYVPGLLLRLFLGLYIYVLPIFPDYGNYISSVLGILFPYLIYIFITKLVVRAEKERVAPIKRRLWYLNIPIVMMLLILVSLVAGLFKYRIIAVGSGSMEPTYFRGDAIIFEYVNADQVRNGDILVFTHSKKIITHRVRSIYYENDKISFKTKGDNNKDNDGWVTTEDDVIGVVRVRVKYVGWPTLWLQDLFNK